MSTATKSAHTTSPWIVESGKKFSGENWLVCSVGRSSEDDLEYYVTTDGVHASELSGDAKYDARLIAAAPELLEALESIQTLAAYMNSSGNGVHGTLASIGAMASAAIRKAKGNL